MTSVRAIAVSGNTVYVGGSFTTAGGVATTGLAKWDGATWSTVGASGLSAFASVYAIAVGVDGLYVGGSFRTAGGINATNIARWDGTNWLSLGFGLGTSPGTLVNAITVIGTDVYVGGSFTNSGGIGVSRIARWNGSGWSALGGGLSATVNGLAAGSDMVFVAGGFTLAGSRPSASFAVWQADTSFPFNLTFLALPGSRVISWPSIPGKSYEMLSTTNLGESFSPLGGNIDSGGSSTSYTNIPAGESIRFFRVRQKP